MTKLICLTGPDGSGKTTLSKALEMALLAQGKSAACVEVWDILSNEAFAKNHPFKNKSQVAQYLKACSSLGRSMFIFHCLLEAIHLGLKKKLEYLIINSYWYKYYLSELYLGTSRPQLDALISVFPKPDIIFYLKITPDIAASRKVFFSEYETGHLEASKENFIMVQKKLIIGWDELGQQFDWISLDACLSIDDLKNKILDQL